MLFVPKVIFSDIFEFVINNIKHGRAWLAQLVRSLPSDHKVPSSILGTAEI